MKINTTLYKISSLILFGLVVSAGTLTYTKAEGDQITVCVKKDGLIYVVGGEFKKKDCKHEDSLLSWNKVGTQGPKGDKGDTGLQGEVGLTGPQGPKGDTYTAPQPSTVTLAEARPTGFNGEWVEVATGYTDLTVDLNSTGYVATYAIQFTNDLNDTTGITQIDVQCGAKNVCPLTTVPILAKYYRVSMGTSEGNITAHGYLISK